MSKYVIADIHGRIDALNEVILKSGFQKEKDLLIVLGDIVDFGMGVRECIDYVLSLPKKIVIMGNHDYWFLNWVLTGNILYDWRYQGGEATLKSYNNDIHCVPVEHIKLIREALFFYLDEKNRLFLHGGYNTTIPIENQDPYSLLWDRTIVQIAAYETIPIYSQVFIGHTRTQMLKSDVPVQLHNLTMCDTGAGRDGFLSIINVDTLEFWQSERQNY